MTVYFTADTHFSHKNILLYENRPYQSIEEMDNDLIEKWNKTVGKNDTVYHLGDFVLVAQQNGKGSCRN